MGGGSSSPRKKNAENAAAKPSGEEAPSRGVVRVYMDILHQIGTAVDLSFDQFSKNACITERWRGSLR